MPPTVLAWWALSLVAQTGAPAPVGFIWHYPFVDTATDELADSGVTQMTGRAHWPALEPTPGRFDWSTVDRQLAVARAAGFRITLILECNSFCAPRWLRERCIAAGENVRGPHDEAGDQPSVTSATYWAAVERFLVALAEHLREADAEHSVSHYHPGIEWWFPAEHRHAPGDVAAFRAWLAERHGGLTGLNRAWGTRFTALEVIDPPRLFPPDLFRRGRDGTAEFQLARPWPHDGLDAACADWQAFWQETARATLGRLAGLVRRIDPTRPTISFQTFAWAAAGEWDYLAWSSTLPDAFAAPEVDELGVQVPLAGGDAHQVSVVLDLLRRDGRRLHALDLLDFTQGTAAGPLVMRRGIHAATAHGARGICICCWAGAGDYGFRPNRPAAEVRALVAEAKAAQAAVDDLRPAPEAALVLPYVPPSPAGLPNDPASFAGFYRLLESLPATVDVITLGGLRGADLSRYRWVLVPHAPAIDRAAADALRRYAAAGGRLLVTPAFGAEVPGCATIPDLGAEYAAPLHRDSFAGDGPPMILWRDQGSRRAVATRRLRAKLAAAGCRPALRLEPDVAAVSVVRQSGPAAYLLRGADQPAPALRLRGLGLARAAVHVDGGPPVTVVADADGALRLPPFEVSCLVRPEAGP